jgi:hypothetical protein
MQPELFVSVTINQNKKEVRFYMDRVTVRRSEEQLLLIEGDRPTFRALRDRIGRTRWLVKLLLSAGCGQYYRSEDEGFDSR